MQINSIRTKFLIILIPLFLLSYAILASLSYYLANEALTKSNKETACEIGKRFSIQIFSEVHQNMIRLEELADSSSVQSGDKKQVGAVLIAAKARLREFESIYFIDLTGRAVSGDGKEYNYSDQEYFRRVIQTKKTFISHPVPSKSTGELSVVMVVPVVNNGEMIGMVGGSVSLENLSNIVKDLHFKETGYGYLADASGVVVAHPNQALTYRLDLTQKIIDSTLKMPDVQLDDRLLNLFKSAVDSGEQSMGRYNMGGATNVAVMTPIEMGGGVRWIMVVTVSEAEFSRESNTLLRSVLFISFISLIFAVLCVLVLTKRLTGPIKIILKECKLLSRGDFEEQLEQIASQDEIGQLSAGFREMRSKIRELIILVKLQAQHVAASSEELAANLQQSAEASAQVTHSISEIAVGTEKQASSVNHISQVIERLHTSTKRIFETTQDVSKLAIIASQGASEGKVSLNQAIEQMKKIGSGAEKIQVVISELFKGSQEINEIVNLISTIAGQTNLLALNAAIEAARAGEHGKGFAVVAEEVRKLAEETNQAALKIGELIKKNDKNMNQSIIVTQDSVQGIRAGISGVNMAGEVFEKIVEYVMNLSKRINGISEDIKQISHDENTLVEAIYKINSISSENAAEAETISAASEEQAATMDEMLSASSELAKLADELHFSTHKFRV
jgi:methyl-accepting chemotaxis protein